MLQTQTTPRPTTAQFADWPLLSNSSGKATPVVSGSILPSPLLRAPHEKHCETFTALSDCLGRAGRLLSDSAIAVHRELCERDPALATDLWALSGVAYATLRQLNDELLVAIQCVNAGDPYRPLDSQIELPRFGPSPEVGAQAAGAIQRTWNSLEAVLGPMLTKYASDDRLSLAMSHVLRQGSQSVHQMMPLLQRGFGAH